MRLLAPALILLPLSALADSYEIRAVTERVTVYPEGAQVERTVTLSAPAGAHRVVVTGIPADLQFGQFRLDLPEGIILGTSTYAEDRLAVTGEDKSAAVLAAEAAIEAAEEALAVKDDAIAVIRARVEAAEARIAFLNRLGGEDLNEGALREAADQIGAEVARARAEAIAARTEIRAAGRGRDDAAEALEDARQALAALVAEGEDGGLLTLELEKTTGEDVTLTVTTYTERAYWAPVYDLYLTTMPEPALHVARGAMIQQESGEDWASVDLTLSTAQIDGRLEPWRPRADLVAIESEEERRLREERYLREMGEVGGMAMPMVEEDAGPSFYAELGRVGDVVTYHYPHPLDLRSGAEGLRVTLDGFDLRPDIFATAVPLHDDTAYLTADTTNTSGQIILPGLTMLYVDGALKGTGEMPLIAEGDHAEIGFGVLEAVRLSRQVPGRSQGGRGILGSSNAREEAVQIEVRNLSDRDWPVRVYDTVPYSEQDDLVVSYTAVPPVSAEAEDGRRGLLRWDMELAAGATARIELNSKLSWPSGMVLVE
ncbi:MAG: DUF4139 domain-containing protein [Rhodobacteraceae bacterium]|nr:DUF4139 domain-containing protein [Paracoccaceae bacterium]